MTIFTIGYQGIGIETFLELLGTNDIDVPLQIQLTFTQPGPSMGARRIY